MPLVTGVSPERGVMRIWVDGISAITVKASTFKDFPIQPGDPIDIETYIDRIAQAQVPIGYEAALTMLSASAKSREQLRRSLLQKGFVQPAVDAILERLTQARLIDDHAYAQRMVDLQTQKPIGKYALKQKLRAKGLSDEDLIDALETISDEDQLAAAKAVAQKFYPRYADNPPYILRGKLSQALARRGFGFDIIEQAVGDILQIDYD